MHDEVDQYVRYNVYKKKASKNKWAMANKILKKINYKVWYIVIYNSYISKQW